MSTTSLERAICYLEKFDSATFTKQDYHKIYDQENKITYDYFANGLYSRFIDNSEYKKYNLIIPQRLALDMVMLDECKKCGNWKRHDTNKTPCKKCLIIKQHKRFLLKMKPYMCSETQDCSICIYVMEKDTIVSKLNCGHEFHTTCIASSVKYKNSCPLCRKPI